MPKTSVLEVTGLVCSWRPLVANVLKRHLCDLSFEGRKEGASSHPPNAGSLIVPLFSPLLSPPRSDRPCASYSAVHKLVLRLFDFSKTYQRHYETLKKTETIGYLTARGCSVRALQL